MGHDVQVIAAVLAYVVVIIVVVAAVLASATYLLNLGRSAIHRRRGPELDAVRSSPTPPGSPNAERRPQQLHPLAWLIAGFLLAVLLGRIFAIEDDDVWATDFQVSALAVIPQVVPADEATVASLQTGQPCTPLFPDGRWASGELVVILDGKQQIRSITTTENPVVLSTSGNVLTCGHPFQIQTTVTGPYIQFNVENRGPEVFTLPAPGPPGTPYAYQLAPLAEGE